MDRLTDKHGQTDGQRNFYTAPTSLKLWYYRWWIWDLQITKFLLHFFLVKHINLLVKYLQWK